MPGAYEKYTEQDMYDAAKVIEAELRQQGINAKAWLPHVYFPPYDDDRQDFIRYYREGRVQDAKGTDLDGTVFPMGDIAWLNPHDAFRGVKSTYIIIPILTNPKFTVQRTFIRKDAFDDSSLRTVHQDRGGNLFLLQRDSRDREYLLPLKKKGEQRDGQNIYCVDWDKERITNVKNEHYTKLENDNRVWFCPNQTIITKMTYKEHLSELSKRRWNKHALHQYKQEVTLEPADTHWVTAVVHLPKKNLHKTLYVFDTSNSGYDYAKKMFAFTSNFEWMKSTRCIIQQPGGDECGFLSLESARLHLTVPDVVPRMYDKEMVKEVYDRQQRMMFDVEAEQKLTRADIDRIIEGLGTGKLKFDEKVPKKLALPRSVSSLWKKSGFEEICQKYNNLFTASGRLKYDIFAEKELTVLHKEVFSQLDSIGPVTVGLPKDIKLLHGLKGSFKEQYSQMSGKVDSQAQAMSSSVQVGAASAIPWSLRSSVRSGLGSLAEGDEQPSSSQVKKSQVLLPLGLLSMPRAASAASAASELGRRLSGVNT